MQIATKTHNISVNINGFEATIDLNQWILETTYMARDY